VKVCTDICEVTVPLPGVTVRGANAEVVFAGSPVTERVTGLVKVFPVVGDTVIVNTAVAPGSADRDGVVEPTVKKSGVEAGVTVTVVEPVAPDVVEAE